MQPSEAVDLGGHYAHSRRRVREVLEAAGREAGDVPVAACPGWSVHDVVAHLVGIIEDVNAGRLQGPPSPAQTSEQVARHSGDGVSDLLEQWDESAPPFENLLSQFQIWPGMLDVLSHEQDIRSALRRPGARDVEGVRAGACRLISTMEAPATVVVTFADASTVSSPAVGEVYGLRTTHFEVLRLRLGRRSPSQVARLDWSRDPTAIFGHLFVFEPGALSLDEPDSQADRPSPGRDGT